MEIIISGIGKLSHFNNFTVALKYDSVASIFSFDMYFNPNDPIHRKIFRPGSYHKCKVVHNGTTLINGIILNHSFSGKDKKELTNLSGYSKTGVIEDCQIPTSLYPLQNDGLSLAQIANKLTGPFDFNIVVDPPAEVESIQEYGETTAKETESIKSYLAGLASQKNLILSHTNEGDLLITKADVNQSPIYHFENNYLDMALSFNGQSMHSELTIQKQADIEGGNSGEESISNPFVSNSFRPFVGTQNSGDDIDTKAATKNALSNEFKGVTLNIEVNGWYLNNNLIQPNRIITVKNPDRALYQSSKWFIESVTLNGNESSSTSTLSCVIPAVYGGEFIDVFRE